MVAGCSAVEQADTESLCERDIAAVAEAAGGVDRERLDLAMTSCLNIEELDAALTNHPGLFNGSGEDLARQRCLASDVPAVQQSFICDELGLATLPPIAPVISVDPDDREATWLVAHLDEVQERRAAMQQHATAVFDALVADDDVLVDRCDEALAAGAAAMTGAASVDPESPESWNGTVGVFQWAMGACVDGNVDATVDLLGEFSSRADELDAWITSLLGA